MIKDCVRVVAFCLLALSALPALAADGQVVVLDATQTAAVFEGVGALSAGATSRLLIDYPEPQRSEILDYLFKPKFGAAIQHLKVEIGGDINSTNGTEPSFARTREEFIHPRPEYFQRGYEWWLMKEAKKRNPQIILEALQWGAPGWIGDGQFYSQDNADFIVAFIQGAKKFHDLDINFCGCWNERVVNTTWLKGLRETLDKNGLTHVRIVGGEEAKKWTMAELMEKDPALRDVVQVIGAHYPRYQSTELARSFGKSLWSTEDGPWGGKWAAASPFSGNLAQLYNRNYVSGKMSKTIIWSPITSNYDNQQIPSSGLMRANEPWCGHYEVQPAIWMTAHTTQFIQPGWKYLAGEACALLEAGGSHVAAVSPDGKDLSLVVETFEAKAPQHLAFKITGGLPGQKLHVWRSTEKEQFVLLDDLPLADGAFTIDVEPGAIYSLTTTTGPSRGAVTSIPPSRPFPLPYRDDFEDYAPGATPKYLSPIHGAFEAVARNDGGKCLQQVVLQKGIPWKGGGGMSAFSIIGNANWKGNEIWRDYEIGCDVCFDFKQYAYICGRLKRMPQRDGLAQALGLRLNADGAWQLLAGDEQLLAGKLSVAPGEWRRVGLRFQGEQITVLLDGKEAGSVTNTTYKNGMVGLGSAFEAVKFDNLSIDRVAPTVGATPAK